MFRDQVQRTTPQTVSSGGGPAGASERFGYAPHAMAVPDLYRTLWRHRYLIVLLTLVATATGYWRASAQPKVYKATALVAIQQHVSDPTQAGNAIGVAQHLAQTYAQIVSTYAMGTRVYKNLDGRVPRGAIDISGEPVQDLELLYISAKARDPNEAAAVANAAPDALRQFVAETGTLHDQIVTVNPAGVPGTPISPHPKRLAILVFLIALIFNCALALVIEFLSDRLPDADEFEASLGKPVLATVPKLVLKPATVEARSEQQPNLVVARRAAGAPRSSSRTGPARG